MYCKNCGQLLGDDVLVCPSCGEPVERPINANNAQPGAGGPGPQYAIPVVYCRNCGQPVHPDALVCPRCGLPLQGSASEPDKNWLGTCAIIFGALGGWLGLLFGIIGLYSSKDERVRKNCKIGIGLFFGWILLAVLVVLLTFCVAAL